MPRPYALTICPMPSALDPCARRQTAYNPAVGELATLDDVAQAVARQHRLADLIPAIHEQALRISGGRASVLLRPESGDPKASRNLGGRTRTARRGAVANRVPGGCGDRACV